MSQTDDRPLSQDVVFDLLSSSRRRFVLYYLRGQEGPVELSELATELAAWENDTAVEDVTERQRKRVYVSLYQTHIPKLQEAGIISYDSDTGEVTLKSRVDTLSRFLAEEEEPFPWQLYYLGLAVVSTLFYLAVWTGIPGFAEIPTTATVFLIVFAFSASAIVQYVLGRRRNWHLPLAGRQG